MNCSWVNETAYDDEGMKHLVERVVQTSHQMHAADPYEDHELIDVQRVTIRYADEMNVKFNPPEIQIDMPLPEKLWSHLEAIKLLAGSEEVEVPRETVGELALVTLNGITNSMSIFRAMLKLYVAATKEVDESAWQRDVTAPCKVLIRKETM